MSAPRVLVTGPHPDRLGGVATTVRAVLEQVQRADVQFLPVGRRRPWDAWALLRDLGRVRGLRSSRQVLHVNPSLRSRALLRDGALVQAWAGPSVAWVHGWDLGLARRLESSGIFRRTFARTRFAALAPPFFEGLVRLGVPPERIDVVPPCWTGDPLPRRPEPRRVLFLGRVEEEKGVLSLIRALHGVEAHLVLAGVGRATKACQALAAELGVTLEVRGWVTGQAKWEELARAEILALPSLEEGVPVVLLEALAAGVPAVATAVGGVPWLSEEGRSVRLVRAGELRDLRDAIVALLEDPERRRELARAGQARAARFHAPVVARELEALWSEEAT